MSYRVIYADSARWRSLIGDAAPLIESDAFTVRKKEGKTLAGILALPDGSRVFLKRTEVVSRAAGVMRRFIGSRASWAIRGARMLREAGFRCAKPLAAMNEIRGGAIVSSYLMSELLDRAQILSIFSLGYHSERLCEIARLRMIAQALAREVRRLHDSGFYTLDLQQTNIMVEDSGAGPVFYFLDLEDFRRAIRVSERRRFLNLVHLDRSIGRHVWRSTRLDFLYKYAGRPASRAERRELVRRYMRVRTSVESSHARRRIARAAGKAIEA